MFFYNKVIPSLYKYENSTKCSTYSPFPLDKSPYLLYQYLSPTDYSLCLEFA